MTFETPIQPRQFTSLRHFQTNRLPASVSATGRKDNHKHETERRCVNNRTVLVVFKAQPLTCLCSTSTVMRVTSLAHLCRMVRCRAATGELSVEPMVPQGDLEIPIITSLINTVEWLTDYNSFYEKRYELLHPALMADLCSKCTLCTPLPADIWSALHENGSLRRFAKFGPMFKTNVLFNPMVVVTDETEVERLLKVKSSYGKIQLYTPPAHDAACTASLPCSPHLCSSHAGCMALCTSAASMCLLPESLRMSLYILVVKPQPTHLCAESSIFSRALPSSAACCCLSCIAKLAVMQLCRRRTTGLSLHSLLHDGHWLCIVCDVKCGGVQAEHKLVESAWPTSMRNLLGPNSILTAGKKGHKQQRQILSQVGPHALRYRSLDRWSCHACHACLWT